MVIDRSDVLSIEPKAGPLDSVQLISWLDQSMLYGRYYAIVNKVIN